MLAHGDSNHWQEEAVLWAITAFLFKTIIKKKAHIKDYLMKNVPFFILKASGLFISGLVGWSCVLIMGQGPAY